MRPRRSARPRHPNDRAEDRMTSRSVRPGWLLRGRRATAVSSTTARPDAVAPVRATSASCRARGPLRSSRPRSRDHRRRRMWNTATLTWRPRSAAARATSLRLGWVGRHDDLHELVDGRVVVARSAAGEGRCPLGRLRYRAAKGIATLGLSTPDAPQTTVTVRGASGALRSEPGPNAPPQRTCRSRRCPRSEERRVGKECA